jgi:hypothetical protein
MMYEMTVNDKIKAGYNTTESIRMAEIDFIIILHLGSFMNVQAHAENR